MGFNYFGPADSSLVSCVWRPKETVVSATPSLTSSASNKDLARIEDDEAKASLRLFLCDEGYAEYLKMLIGILRFFVASEFQSETSRPFL
jgi:hypothetical protein